MLKDNSPIGVDEILKQAFGYWSRTLMFQVVFSIIYFSITLVVVYFLLTKFGLIDDVFRLFATSQKDVLKFTKDYQAFLLLPEFSAFILYFSAIKAVIFPLNIGFYQIYRKLDLNESIEMGDLFVGFRGSNFFKYSGYALFWGMISLYSGLFSVLWVFITLFNAPIMFFLNRGIFESISLSIGALKRGFIIVAVCVFVAFLFSYSGLLLFFVGYAFTFPFWNAMIYSLYKNFFTEVNSKA